MNSVGDEEKADAHKDDETDRRVGLNPISPPHIARNNFKLTIFSFEKFYVIVKFEQ